MMERDEMSEILLHSKKDCANIRLEDYPDALAVLNDMLSHKKIAEVRIGKTGLLIREIKSTVKYQNCRS